VSAPSRVMACRGPSARRSEPRAASRARNYRSDGVSPPAEHRDDDLPDLVRRAAGGDHVAYDVLVDRFAGLVWKVARSHRLSQADAADVSQTVWLRLVEQLGRIREPERLGGWLATTTRHECLAVLRRRDRLVLTDDTTSASTSTPGGVELPVDAEHLVRHERRTAVQLAFRDLDERCQDLLRMLLTDPPATYDEVTAAMGLPTGSIGPTRQRCLGRLHRHPALAGITEDDGGSSVSRT
jgi:RNA polymerase sigma factor (sigma-70 family)